MTNYLFNPFFDSFFEPSGEHRNEAPNVMDVDIYETETGYQLEADLPGFDKKDVSIEFEKGYLTISAAKQKAPHEGVKQVYNERRYGKLRRRFYFGEIDEEHITAKLENGVMVVTLPKLVEKKTTKNIQIA